MLSVTKFKDYLKTQFPAVSYYVGRIDKSNDHCIGVYPSGRTPSILAIGGVQNSSYAAIGISLLIHYGKTSDVCEAFAQQIYNHLHGLSKFEYDGVKVISVSTLDGHPIDMQSDDKGIFEMVIRLTVYYEKEVS